MQPLPPKLTSVGAISQLRERLRLASNDEPEARAASRLLMNEVLGSRDAHLLQPERELTNEEAAQLQNALQRLLNGEPLPHILGRAFFHGLELRCDARALIPRPETELLVDEALRRLKDVPNPNIADLGTGSGAIALAMAVARPDATVWASDVSEQARELAQENARALNVRLNIVPGLRDYWDASLNDDDFDAVLCNPPYIPTREIATLQPQLAFEPRLALDGGDDGLRDYHLLAQQAHWLLIEGGFFACELGAGQFEAVRDLFEAQGWQVAPPLHDLAGIARVLVAMRK